MHASKSYERAVDVTALGVPQSDDEPTVGPLTTHCCLPCCREADVQRCRRPPPPLPSGTLTFLLTDIEGSTRLWQDAPDAMQIALARHDVILRQGIETHGGRVFKTAGDAFFAAFTQTCGCRRQCAWLQTRQIGADVLAIDPP